jgi:uncharacterized RDD family membrane protein YckC
MPEGAEAEIAPQGARCAAHVEAPASNVCARCGDYGCPSCARRDAVAVYCARCFETIKQARREHFGEATLGQRFANYLIDSFLGVMALALAFGLALGVLGFEALLDEIPDLVFRVALIVIYYVTLEGFFGTTLGKLITRTMVIAQDGGKAGFGRILGRSLIRLVPFEGFSFWFSDHGWHDAWSKTRVVRLTPGKLDRWQSLK